MEKFNNEDKNNQVFNDMNLVIVMLKCVDQKSRGIGDYFI